MSPIVDISQADAQRFSLGTVGLKHRFADSGLFSDDALAELVESYPAEHRCINASEEMPDGTVQWRYGSVEGLSGADIIEAVRHGRLWINLQHMEEVATRYHALVKRAFDRIKDLNPNLTTFKHNTGLLISSPSMRVLYHCDIPPIALWHIRGRKRLWLYPPTEEFLSDVDRERVVLRETEEEVPYDPAFDAHATTFDMEAGDAAAWATQAPHRVDNLDGLNVSITTSYFTPAARRHYGVIYANGAMRRLMGVAPRSTKSTGPIAYAKCGLAAAVRMSGILKERERVLYTTFKVDPSKDIGYVDFAGSRI